MEDTFVTIGELDLVNSLKDKYKLLIDDSTEGDTKAAYVNVLKKYLIDDIRPHINIESGTWYVGDVDTGVFATSSSVRKVLWEGIATVDNRNFFSESINSYKYLEVQWGTNLKNGSYRTGRPLFLEVETIKYRTSMNPNTVLDGEGTYVLSEMLTNGNNNTTQMHMGIQFSFYDNLSFVILSPIRVHGWDTVPNITRIIGIR